MKAAAVLLLLLCMSLPLFCGGLGRRDPLTPAEIDELRETAQEPDLRILAFVKFLRARGNTLEQLRSDPRMDRDRVQQIHDLLDDITALIDEMDDNIDTYTSRKADLRKAIKNVIALDGELQTKLHSLGQTGIAAATDRDTGKLYAFSLTSATEAVNSSLQNARQALEEQEAYFKAQKEAKKKR